MKVSKNKMKKQLFKAMAQQGYIIRGSKIFSPAIETKGDIRNLHYYQKISRFKSEKKLFADSGFELIKAYFADGKDVDPKLFEPELIPVSSNDWTGKLFRIATLLWSVPVSKGYGRRIRFLLMDKSINKLAGIIAIGDPVFNLKVRDDFIGWDAADRKERLFHVMDAYVLGAVPPYNQLLVGKFLAGILSTNEVRNYFTEKYKNSTTIIQGKRKKPDLVLITTTSALGKSSIYNRVFIDRGSKREHLVNSIGFTAGYGHFHVPENIFNLMREFLEERGEKYAHSHKFGQGPNWRMRVIRKTMDMLGYPKTPVLQHGIKREVFLSPLANNYKEYLRGENPKPEFINLSLDEYNDYFKDRFMIPRFEKKPEIINHRSLDVYNEIRKTLINEETSEELI